MRLRTGEHARKEVYTAKSTTLRGLQQTNDKFVSYELVPPIECLILSMASCAVIYADRACSIIHAKVIKLFVVHQLRINERVCT